MKIPGIDEDPIRGGRIRDLREARHLSQEQLGDAVGVSKWAIGKWEAGKPMQRAHLEKLAAELRTSAGYILDGEDSSEKPLAEVLVESLARRLDDSEERASRIDARLSRRLDEQQAHLEALQALVEVLAAQSPNPLPADVKQLLESAPRRGTGPATD